MRLGDARAAVRARLGCFRVFRRTPEASETDHFVDRGIQVTYDSSNHVDYIELTVPAKAALNGVELLQRPLAEVMADLRALGFDCSEDEGGAYVPAADVGLFVNVGVIESVSVGESKFAKPS